MKAHLLYKEGDFAPERTLAPNGKNLIQDLQLDVLFDTMAQGDKFVLDVSRKVVLSSLHERDAIIYRQHIVEDCLKNSSVVKEIRIHFLRESAPLTAAISRRRFCPGYATTGISSIRGKAFISGLKGRRKSRSALEYSS